MRKYSFNKASSKLFKVLCFFRPLSKEKERKKESREKEREQRETETHDEPLLLNFFVLKKKSPPRRKKKDQKTQESERRVLSPVTKNPSGAKRTRRRAVATLHTHNTRFHHGTQTNLETVHLQNDRVRAFIKPSERCSNVQHRHRGVEIRELARVVRT
jgi:hypothetical protein